ncbi:MAG: TIGR02147 family protein [Bdellovibrio sp.]|nr:TIGR02147 family protein [Bdellovibrio sp.]
MILFQTLQYNDNANTLRLRGSLFSYESWATELGVSSRSHLRLSIIGRRTISDSLAQSLIDNIRLTGQDKDYFQLLLLYSQSSTAKQKTYYSRKLAEFFTAKVEKKSVQPTLDLLRDPTVIALRLLLTFEDVSGTESELSQRMGLSLEETQSNLRILRSHGLVTEESFGLWKATSKWIQFEETKDNSGIRAYHAASLDAAKQSMTYPANSRHFRSLTWAMNEDEYQEFLSEMNEFIEKMSSKFEKNTLDDRRLMQLNLNLIPALMPNQDKQL